MSEDLEKLYRRQRKLIRLLEKTNREITKKEAAEHLSQMTPDERRRWIKEESRRIGGLGGAVIAPALALREWWRQREWDVPGWALASAAAVVLIGGLLLIPPLLDGPDGEPFDVPRGGGEATPSPTPTFESTPTPTVSPTTPSPTATPTPTTTGSPTLPPTASPTPPEPTLTPSPSPPPSPTPSPTQTEPTASPTPTFSPPPTPTPTRPPTPTPTPTQRDCVKLPLGDDDDDLCVDEDGFLACLRLLPVAERLCLLNLDDLLAMIPSTASVPVGSASTYLATPPDR